MEFHTNQCENTKSQKNKKRRTCATFLNIKNLNITVKIKLANVDEIHINCCMKMLIPLFFFFLDFCCCCCWNRLFNRTVKTAQTIFVKFLAPSYFWVLYPMQCITLIFFEYANCVHNTQFFFWMWNPSPTLLSMFFMLWFKHNSVYVILKWIRIAFLFPFSLFHVSFLDNKKKS